jgi:hypothetical protein
MKILPVMLLLIFACLGRCQQARPLNSATAKTEYSFAVRPGRPPLTIRVEIGAGGKIGDALLFRQGASTPFQRLGTCSPDLVMELYEGDEDQILVDHADFNFDGFEDLKLLQFHHPHLGKSIFCVYLWDEKSSEFRYEPQIPMPDPIPHRENRTITTHDEYMGGTWSDSVYIWLAGKVIPIAEWGVANEGGPDGANADCTSTAWCAKRINGMMRNVARKRTGCDGAAPEPVKCTPPPVSARAPGKH